MSKPVLRIPIAKLGKWHSAKYKTVEFTQEDFNDLKNNFERNVRGYEPYLRYGHNKKGPNLDGGEPALGHLKEMYQDNDVLWGVFEPTRAEVVDEIRNGEYRYASAEVIRGAKDKVTGERLNIFLKGHALTNEPFIPNLPRNFVDDTQYLSEEGTTSEFCLIALSEYFPSMSTCSNCGQTAQGELCLTCTEATRSALAPLAKPEVTMLQTMSTAIKSLLNRFETMPGEIANAVTQNLSDAQKPSEAPETPEITPPVSEGEQEPVSEDAPEPVADEPAETDPEQEQEMNQMDSNIPEQPAAPAAAEPSELEAIKAQLEALKAEKEEALKIAEEASAALDAKLQAERVAAEEAAVAAAEAKEQEFAVMLNDRVESLVSKGVPPMLAERAKSLIQSLRGTVTEEQSFVLSEGEEAVDLVEGVFSLLSDSTGVVDFGTHGMQPIETNTAGNPWADRLAAIRAKRQG